MKVDDEILSKLAYRIPQLVKATGIGRSLVHEEIKAGRLRATKLRGLTLILHEDSMAWLRSYRDGRGDRTGA